MWKDWFFFSKSQRIGVITLLTIILALIGAKIAIPHLVHPKASKQDNFVQQAMAFEDSLHKQAPQSNYHSYTHYEEQRLHYNSYPKYEKQVLPAPVLSRFNPNEIDSAHFVKLGIKPKIASNILKYRAKGGKFKKAEDFGKVWGITTEQLQTLQPYIDIPPEAAINQAATNIKPKKIDGTLELNSADTTQLQQIRGIGAGYAKRIVAYKKRLGGFASVEQLHEVWGMTPELYDKIAPHFTVNNQLIQKIEINKASVERLKNHPYLNFYKAKAIYELRLTKGKLKGIQELRKLEGIDDVLLGKIEPYLSFQ